MADLNPTESDIVVPSTAPTLTGIMSAAVSTLDVVKYNSTTGKWDPCPPDAAVGDQVALVVSGGVVADQLAVLLQQSGVDITVGSIVSQQQIYVISAANDGKIAPIGDLTPGTDLAYIVGIGKSATVLRTLFTRTGA